MTPARGDSRPIEAFLQDGIKAWAEELAPILSAQRVAVVVYKPTSQPAIDAAKIVGWKEHGPPVFELGNALR